MKGRKNNELEVFLNDYNLATCLTETSGMKMLTATWVFITLN